MIEKKQLTIESREDELPIVTDASEAYSYQYNDKITAMPSNAEQESTEMTANLCFKLFAVMECDMYQRRISTSPTNAALN